MRLSTTLQLAIAPMAFARYGRFRRTNHVDAGMEAGVPVEKAPPAEHVVAPPAEPVAPPAEHVAPPAEHVAPPAEHVMPPAEHVAPPAEHVVAPPAEHVNVGGVQAIVIWVNEGAGAEASTVHEQETVTETITVEKDGKATEVPGIDGTTTIDAGATGVVEHMGATHSVEVGGEQGLSYFPQEVEAKVGDMIIFTFYAMNHTVTQSSFDKPCSLLEGGMDSGFIPNPDNSIDPPPQVAMQVMTEDPLWMYCAQGNHCGQGMVFSINPSAEKTHAQFQANAIAQEGDGDATGIVGGGDSAAPPEGSETAAPSEGEAAPPADTAAPTEDGAVLPTDASEPIDGAVNGGVVMGVGTIGEDGSCQCAVMCGAGSFPNAAQGGGSFGGMPGSISMGTVGGGEGDASASLPTDVPAPSEDAGATSTADAGETGSAEESAPAETGGAEESAPAESGDAEESAPAESGGAEESAAETGGDETDAEETPAESGGAEESAPAEESPVVTPPEPVTPPARR